MNRTIAAEFTSRLASPAALCALFLVLLSGGCKSSSSHTSNPQLRQIDEIVNKQLPPGSPMARVNFFLNSRGYQTEPAEDTHSIVAVIEHVDAETLQPSAARVTFHFDSNDKLLTYDLAPATPRTIQR
jgi:hypothetical protein